jgi:hypothetical protein
LDTAANGLIGFLEGYDFACPASAKARTSGLDSEGLFERVDAICRSSPATTPLLIVAIDLIKQLDPQHSDICLH